MACSPAGAADDAEMVQAHAPLTIVDLPAVLLQHVLKAFVSPWVPLAQQDARTLIVAACSHSELRAAARQVIPQELGPLRSLPPFLSCIVSKLVVGSALDVTEHDEPPVFDSYVDGFSTAPILFALLQRRGRWRSFCVHTELLESEVSSHDDDDEAAADQPLLLHTYYPHDDLYLTLTDEADASDADAGEPKLFGTLSFCATAPTIDETDEDVHFAPDPESPEFIDVELAALDAPALTVTPRGAGPIWSGMTLRLLKPHSSIEFSVHDYIDPEDSEIETGWGSVLISREATPADSPDTGKIGLLLKFVPEGTIESDEESLTGGEDEEGEEEGGEEEGEEEYEEAYEEDDELDVDM
jgi:hypothetical protein